MRAGVDLRYAMDFDDDAAEASLAAVFRSHSFSYPDSSLAAPSDDGHGIGSDGFPDDKSRYEPSCCETTDADKTQVEVASHPSSGSVLAPGRYQAALNGAVSECRSFEQSLKQPWERGPMKFLFGDSLPLNVPMKMAHAPPRAPQAEHDDTGTAETDTSGKKRKISSIASSLFVITAFWRNVMRSEDWA